MSTTEYMRLWRAKNRIKVREYNREYNKAWRKQKGYQNEINSKKRYPEKVRARILLNQTIKRGLITRGKCFCGEVNTHGHHTDYSRPLKVIWLCPLHHKQLHQNETKRLSGIKRNNNKEARLRNGGNEKKVFVYS
jgi:hypothetical protein